VTPLQRALLFDVDKCAIKPAAAKELGDVAPRLRGYAGAEIIVDGHTDSTASDEHNRVLTQKRAQSVRDFLVSSGGIDARQFETHGYGESRPIAGNETEEGREKNRRVEIIMLPRR